MIAALHMRKPLKIRHFLSLFLFLSLSPSPILSLPLFHPPPAVSPPTSLPPSLPMIITVDSCKQTDNPKPETQQHIE